MIKRGGSTTGNNRPWDQSQPKYGHHHRLRHQHIPQAAEMQPTLGKAVALDKDKQEEAQQLGYGACDMGAFGKLHILGRS